MPSGKKDTSALDHKLAALEAKIEAKHEAKLAAEIAALKATHKAEIAELKTQLSELTSTPGRCPAGTIDITLKPPAAPKPLPFTGETDVITFIMDFEDRYHNLSNLHKTDMCKQHLAGSAQTWATTFTTANAAACGTGEAIRRPPILWQDFRTALIEHFLGAAWARERSDALHRLTCAHTSARNYSTQLTLLNNGLMYSTDPQRRHLTPEDLMLLFMRNLPPQTQTLLDNHTSRATLTTPLQVVSLIEINRMPGWRKPIDVPFSNNRRDTSRTTPSQDLTSTRTAHALSAEAALPRPSDPDAAWQRATELGYWPAHWCGEALPGELLLLPEAA